MRKCTLDVVQIALTRWRCRTERLQEAIHVTQENHRVQDAEEWRRHVCLMANTHFYCS